MLCFALSLRTGKHNMEAENKFKDKTALQLLEKVFDKYHFNDSDLLFGDSALKILFESMITLIEKDLPDTPKVHLVKVVASINTLIFEK